MKAKIIILVLIFLIFIQCANNTPNNNSSKPNNEPTESNFTEKKQPEPLKNENSESDTKEKIQVAFLNAVRTGEDTLEIIDLANKGADVNFIDEQGNYPLLIANGRPGSSIKDLIVKKLVDLGALDINSLIGQFFKYCEEGNIDSIEMMLADGFNINWKERYYEELEEGGGCGCMCEKTAIFIASKNQDIRLVNFLIKNGAKVYLEEGALQPLEPAILNMNWELARLLLENGANKDVSVCLWWGWDGLTSGNTYYHKLKFQDTTTLNFLIRNDFPYPNPEDFEWVSTPLDYAVMDNDTLILKRLIALTENNEVLSKALCYARRFDIAKILIKNGAQTNFVYSWAGEGNSGEVISPLYTAIKEEDTALVNLYIQSGADINIFYDDYNGKSLELPFYYEIGFPLLIAAEKGNMDIVKTLLNKGAKVNFAIRRNYYGEGRVDKRNENKYAFWQTPLVAAVSRNDKLMVKLFIDKGANVVVEGDTITNYDFGKEIDMEILNLLNNRLSN